MKKLFIASSLLLIALGNSAYAASASGTSHVRIITPIAISPTTTLEFGSIGASGSSGTIVITAAGGVSATGGATLLTSGLTRTAGAFDITGESNATYTISLPSSASLTSGGDAITVNTFSSTPTSPGALSAGGTQTLNIGATLQVSASQNPGSYTGTYPITVVYN